ncbi:signal peptidase II [Altererythrobacter sp. B11]|uniref:signal peptidase II n=1 Tax=Altererythrobacter sp. B11 TaxID=2060312 RepID=UPI000DC6D7B8|nr:signal peptidase II [Altererythrobacter sp. B11]BBC71375.1 signal peptidase II [Altererythrobacter sp. B11]
MSPAWRNRLIGLLLAAVVTAVDKWVKLQVLGPWQVRERGSIELLPYFNLTFTRNFGVSLGMFEATSMEMRWMLVAVTGLIALVVFVWLLRERRAWDIMPLALVLGGAIGNIHDRYRYGFVVDYADFHIGSFRPFLVFNVADAAITVGVVIILARALFIREKPEGEQQADRSAEIT